MSPNLTRIIDMVGAKYGITRDNITGKNATRYYARPRQIAMFIARGLTDYSLLQLAGFFDRDHTTIMHGCRRVGTLMSEDQVFFDEVNEISRRCELAKAMDKEAAMRALWHCDRQPTLSGSL